MGHFTYKVFNLQNRFAVDYIDTSTVEALQKLWLKNVPSK
ncbi:hypothetical protein A2U01_0115275, partial [Trifolium medium]|nr:hypothetical protein [Trifolium medium]